jgi:hypothetical protein
MELDTQNQEIYEANNLFNPSEPDFDLSLETIIFLQENQLKKVKKNQKKIPL